MKLQQQKYPYDCALACLATISGREYDDLWESTKFIGIQERDLGIYGDTLDEAIEHAGFHHYKRVYTGRIENYFLKDLLFDRIALLQVRSLNNENAKHMIVWDRNKILDPSTKQVYRFFSSIGEVDYVWIFPLEKNNGE